MKTLLLAGALLLSSCTDAKNSRRALEDYGFTAIETTGYAWWGCGDDYTFHTKFNATNAAGRRVSGVVCCGWLKGCTVKF